MVLGIPNHKKRLCTGILNGNFEWDTVWDTGILFYVTECVMGYVMGICNGIYHDWIIHNRMYYGQVQLDIFDGNRIQDANIHWEYTIGYQMI